MLSEVSEMSDGKVTTAAPHGFSQVPSESLKLAAARTLPYSSKGGRACRGGRTIETLRQERQVLIAQLEVLAREKDEE